MSDFDVLFSDLFLSEDDVYGLSVVERERRVDDLIVQAFDIYDYAVREYVTDRNRSGNGTPLTPG